VTKRDFHTTLKALYHNTEIQQPSGSQPPLDNPPRASQNRPTSNYEALLNPICISSYLSRRRTDA
jgi:hypothetical protein